MVMLGFGVINLVILLVDVQMDLILVVVIIGQVGWGLIGIDVFQEVDILGIMMLIIKYNFLVCFGDDILWVLVEVFYIVVFGCLGVVLVDIFKDVLQGQCMFSWLLWMELFGYKFNIKLYSWQVCEVVKLIVVVCKLVLYVGGGVICGEVIEQFWELVELIGILVVIMLMVCGVFFDSYW